MHSELSEEIHDRITSFCKKISVAHHLDEDIGNELHDHIIDKMGAYLNGEEVLSEDDAFVLVKEHFGNPDVIRSMYESAEPSAAYGSMLRRIEAATVATIFCFILGSYVSELFFSLLAKLTPNMSITETYIFAIPKTLSQFVGIILFGAVLSLWRAKLNRGEQPWFYRIKQYWFLGLIFSSILFMLVIIQSTIKFHLPYNFFTYITFLFSMIFHCIFWLMWIDNNSEQIHSILFGFFSWIVIQYSIADIIYRVTIFNYPDYSGHLGIGLIPTIFIWWVGIPSVIAIFIYTMLVGIHRVKTKLIGSFA